MRQRLAFAQFIHRNTNLDVKVRNSRQRSVDRHVRRYRGWLGLATFRWAERDQRADVGGASGDRKGTDHTFDRVIACTWYWIHFPAKLTIIMRKLIIYASFVHPCAMDKVGRLSVAGLLLG